MRTYLAVILSAATVAALLASPATARSRYYGYYGSYRSYGPRYGTYHDFQDGPRGQMVDRLAAATRANLPGCGGRCTIVDIMPRCSCES